MKRSAKALFAAVLAALSPVLPVAAQQPGFPQTMPPSTVYGRSAISAGPGQAIPFSVLIQTLNNTANTWSPTQTFQSNIIGQQLLELTNSAPLSAVDLQTVVPTNGFYASGSGAVFQNCPLIGCVAGDHQQSALYLKATATLDKSIAEYMATFDCNLNSGSTGTPAGPGNFSDAKVCAFISSTTSSLAGNATWGMANDFVVGSGDTGLFKVNTELDFTNNGTDCAVGVKNCYTLYLSGNATNPITAFLAIAPVGSVTNAHYAILVNGAHAADAADIEDSGGAAIGISVGGLLASSHSTASIADASTSPIGIKLTGTYSAAAIEIPSGSNICFAAGSNCISFTGGALTATATLKSNFLQTTASLIAGLPACNAGNTGVITAVTNGVATPTFGSTVSTTGSTWSPVVCNGTNWIYG